MRNNRNSMENMLNNTTMIDDRYDLFKPLDFGSSFIINRSPKGYISPWLFRIIKNNMSYQRLIILLSALQCAMFLFVKLNWSTNLLANNNDPFLFPV